MSNWDETFTLESDASNIWLGEALKQRNRSIAYVLKVLHNAGKNYSIPIKEAALPYGQWRKFNLITDHQVMASLKKKAEFRLKKSIDGLKE